MRTPRSKGLSDDNLSHGDWKKFSQPWSCSEGSGAGHKAFALRSSFSTGFFMVAVPSASVPAETSSVPSNQRNLPGVQGCCGPQRGRWPRSTRQGSSMFPSSPS